MAHFIENLGKILRENGVKKNSFCNFNFDKSILDGSDYQNLSVYSSKRIGDEFDIEELIIYFPVVDKYIRVTGSYSSWDSTDFSYAEFIEVKPVKKIVEVITWEKC